MNYSAAVILLICASSMHALSPEIQAKFAECTVETGVSVEIAEMARLHDFSFDADENGKCFVKCLAKTLKVIDDKLDLDSKFFEANTKVDKEKVMIF